jgi:hypothetical protein
MISDAVESAPAEAACRSLPARLAIPRVARTPGAPGLERAVAASPAWSRVMRADVTAHRGADHRQLHMRASDAEAVAPADHVGRWRRVMSQLTPQHGAADAADTSIFL